MANPHVVVMSTRPLSCVFGKTPCYRRCCRTYEDNVTQPTSGRFVAHRLSMMGDFFRSEAAGGVLLIGAAVLAMIWSNSAWAPAYEAFLTAPLGFTLGPVVVSAHLDHFVNDALMALFFLLVGLEIRREMTEGALASPARIAAPGIAALGGMVVPAAIFAALNWGDSEAIHGWAVPVATDIAFSLAVLRVLGKRVPGSLRLFLTALAIIDDLLAILVIAIFYTAGLSAAALVGAVALWLAMVLLNRSGVRVLWPYLVGGIGLWALVAFSGVHATLAGVALAFAVPAKPAKGRTESAATRLEHGLTGIVGFVVLPLFGLANAGLRLDALPAHALTDTLVWGIIGGLFIGKQVGVFGMTYLSAKLGLIRLPGGLSTRQLYGASVLCGIGFTMSLFIGDLAFRGHPRHADVKLAVFAASILSAVVGLAVLWGARRKPAVG